MPYRIVRTGSRRGFYLLLVSGALAGLIALGLAVATSLQQNSGVAKQALRRADRALVAQTLARVKADQAHQLTQALVAEEARSCAAQNRRHDATVRELDRLLSLAIAKLKTPRRRAQIEQSRRFTVLLIDQLAPVRDCKRLAGAG